MNAKSIAMALGGRKVGTGWMARCPAHDDRHPSLSIRDTEGTKVLVRCHAGCDQSLVIGTLRELKLWPENGSGLVTSTHVRAFGTRLSDTSEAMRTKNAIAIWEAAMPANDTLIETYLASRGLHLSPPPTLRFHVGLKHYAGDTWPTMVALVTRGPDDTPMGIHRTFLARDGAGKAPVDPAKMMLGPCRGGAVRLAEAGEMLMVGEGIETCLAAMQATNHPTWAALSTSGLKNLELPANVRDVVVLADGDDPGESAARDCAARWKRQGRDVRIARAPRGQDFNDLLPRSKPGIQGDAQ